MKTSQLEPFVVGVEELVTTMFQTACYVTVPLNDTGADVSGVIELIGDTRGQLALSFPRATATRMVAQLLAVSEDEVDDSLLGDGVGELANIVAGVAKSRFLNASDRFKLSVPSVILSEQHQLTLFSATGVIHRRVVTELGEFSLRIWFPT